MKRHKHQRAKNEPAPMTGPELRECDGDRTTIERIRARAYEIFLARRGGPGDELSDWLQAEREIMTPEPTPTNRPHFRLAPRGLAEVVVPPRGEILLRSDS